mmetsp:Transcript_68453/g.178235  ORF Transcript_68453/g.178235 Transcript_68453/m.178235 type:complete len:256 (-) Transcript_68453:400-1167(-)
MPRRGRRLLPPRRADCGGHRAAQLPRRPRRLPRHDGRWQVGPGHRLRRHPAQRARGPVRRSPDLPVNTLAREGAGLGGGCRRRRAARRLHGLVAGARQGQRRGGRRGLRGPLRHGERHCGCHLGARVLAEGSADRAQRGGARGADGRQAPHQRGVDHVRCGHGAHRPHAHRRGVLGTNLPSWVNSSAGMAQRPSWLVSNAEPDLSKSSAAAGHKDGPRIPLRLRPVFWMVGALLRRDAGSSCIFSPPGGILARRI